MRIGDEERSNEVPHSGNGGMGELENKTLLFPPFSISFLWR